MFNFQERVEYVHMKGLGDKVTLLLVPSEALYVTMCLYWSIPLTERIDTPGPDLVLLVLIIICNDDE